MKKMMLLSAIAFTLEVFAAGELAWPSDFADRVAARETARVAATSSVPASNDVRLELAGGTVATALDAAYFGTCLWWLEVMNGFAIDTNARTGFRLIIR